MFDYVLKQPTMIANDIREVKRCDDDPMSQILCNEKTPSQEPYYRYVLEELEGGISHSEFQDKIEKTTNPMDYIEERTRIKKLLNGCEQTDTIMSHRNAIDNIISSKLVVTS